MPFEDACFDAVVSQFGLMFMDGDRAIREMLRVLAPGGRLACAVWDALENIPAYAREVDLLQRMAGPRAADALRAPFVLGDPQRLATLMRDAGAHAVAVDTRRGTARFPDVRTMVEADLRGWLPIMGVHLADAQIEAILQEARTVLREWVQEDGRVTFEVRAHLVTATRP